MSTEQNKATARLFQEEYNARNWEGRGSLLASDCVSYQPGAPEPLNKEQLEGMERLFASAFPDMKVTTHDQIAEGDTVVTRMRFTGTHQHDFQGLPPTGKTINLEGYILDRIVDGKIVEHHGMFDRMTLMEQLGVIPAPQAV